MAARDHSDTRTKIIRDFGNQPDYVLYTDACATGGKMAAVLSRAQNPKSRQVDQTAKGACPRFWIGKFERANLIYGLFELLTLVAYVAQSKIKLRNRTINIYLYNDNSNAALIRGDSDTEIIARLVCHFWRIAQEVNLTVWIGRVASNLNIADVPTRLQTFPYPVRERVEFKNLFKLTIVVDRAFSQL